MPEKNTEKLPGFENLENAFTSLEKNVEQNGEYTNVIKMGELLKNAVNDYPEETKQFLAEERKVLQEYINIPDNYFA